MLLNPRGIIIKKSMWALVGFLSLCLPARAQDLSTELMEAIRTRNTSEVQQLLRAGADANAKDRNGMTPLVQAAIAGSTEAVRALLENGANVNSRANDGMTALFWAASSGNTNIVRALLDKGADVNTKNNSGWTALMSAADLGHLDTVRALLEKGADVHVRDKDGNTALRLAVKYKYSGIIALLRSPPPAPQDKSPKDASASTPRVSSGTSAAESVPVPKSKKTPSSASVSAAQPATSAPAKNELLNQKLLQAAEAGDAAEVLSLIREGAGVNARGATYGNTALMAAAARGNTDIVRALLDKGGEVDATDTAGRTALMEAAFEGFTDTASALLQKGANVNAHDNQGWTPLFWAAFSRRTETVRFLLHQGADVNARNKYEDTALIQSASRGDTDTLSVLLENKVDVNAKDDMGNTALIEAARQGHTDTVRALLEKGADVHVQARDGNNALSVAEKQHRTDIIALLKNAPRSLQNEGVGNTTTSTLDAPPGDSPNSDPLATATPAMRKKIKAQALFRTGLNMRLVEDLWPLTGDLAERAATSILGDLKKVGAPLDLIQLAEEASNRLALAPEDRKGPVPSLIRDLRKGLNILSMSQTEEQFYYAAGEFTYDLNLFGRELAKPDHAEATIEAGSGKSLFSATVMATECSALPECKERVLSYFQNAISILQKTPLVSADGTALIKLSDDIAVALSSNDR